MKDIFKTGGVASAGTSHSASAPGDLELLSGAAAKRRRPPGRQRSGVLDIAPMKGTCPSLINPPVVGGGNARGGASDCPPGEH